MSGAAPCPTLRLVLDKTRILVYRAVGRTLHADQLGPGHSRLPAGEICSCIPSHGQISPAAATPARGLFFLFCIVAGTRWQKCCYIIGMSKISEFVDHRLYELSRREEETNDDSWTEIVHGLSDLKVTTRVSGIAGYLLDDLAEVLEISRSKLAAMLLEEAIQEAVKAANRPELDFAKVSEWAEKNGLIRDARKQASD